MQRGAAYYDRLARSYRLAIDPFERRVRSIGLRLLAARPGERVLEIGFGTGEAVIALARAVGPTGQVEGIDTSPGMNRVANRRVQAAGLGDHVALMLTDPTRLPFENGRFDALFMSFTLEVIEPTERGINVLRVGRRVLRPGGRLVIVSLSDRDDAAATSRAYAWARSALPGLVDCRPISAASMLATAGLTVGTELRLTTWGLPVDVVRATR